jgi:hypothetical protein
MIREGRISRRTILKGLGTAIAVPFLDAMLPQLFSAPAASIKAAAPRRMAFFYVPNGVKMDDWTPAEAGANFKLPSILEPLRPVQQDLLVLSGLAVDKAKPHGDGPGDHARAMSAFLTGKQPRKTSGADIRVGISADQVAALQVGKHTPFASLELGLEKGLQAGNCDSGYSCAYSANLSWRGDSTPMAKEVDPRQVFERLFSNQVNGETAEARAKRDLYKKSILDFVAEDANRLQSQLGATDKRKLDEYLSSIREIELRIARSEQQAKVEAPDNVAKPDGIPKEYQDHARLLLDMLVLAFQADQTRISTFVLANDGSNHSYKTIGVPEGHHDLSHHQKNKDKLEKLRKINQFHMAQFAYFLTKLRGIKEGDGTLLDQSMIIYGSGIGDGDRHNHDDLPIVLAGKGGGSIRTGRHLKYKKDTPLTNLFVAMLNRMDVPIKSFGDSNGELTDLSA